MRPALTQCRRGKTSAVISEKQFLLPINLRRVTRPSPNHLIVLQRGRLFSSGKHLKTVASLSRSPSLRCRVYSIQYCFSSSFHGTFRETRFVLHYMITIKESPIINLIYLAPSTLGIIRTHVLNIFSLLRPHVFLLFYVVAVWSRYATEQSGPQLCSCSSNPVAAGRAGKVLQFPLWSVPGSLQRDWLNEARARLPDGCQVGVEEGEMKPSLQRPIKW